MQDQQNNSLPSAFSLFSLSAKAVMLNLGTILALILGPSLLLLLISLTNLGVNFSASSAGGSSAQAVSTGMNIFAIFGGLATVLLMVAIAPAVAVTQLASVRGQKIGVKEAFTKGLTRFWPFIFGSLLVGLLFVIGLIFLVVPGFIILRRYVLASYYIVDQNMGISEAMSASAAATKKNTMAIWGVFGVSILINIPSIIPVLGQITSTILALLYTCAFAFRYEQLRATSSPQATSSTQPGHQTAQSPIS